MTSVTELGLDVAIRDAFPSIEPRRCGIDLRAFNRRQRCLHRVASRSISRRRDEILEGIIRQRVDKWGDTINPVHGPSITQMRA